MECLWHVVEVWASDSGLKWRNGGLQEEGEPDGFFVVGRSVVGFCVREGPSISLCFYVKDGGSRGEEPGILMYRRKVGEEKPGTVAVDKKDWRRWLPHIY